MTRDMDLIRQLLLSLETQKHIENIPGRTAEEIAYHISLLEEAGLVTQEIYQNLYLNDSMLEGICITWAGHEFLDASRNISFWEKEKKLQWIRQGHFHMK